MIGVFDSGVGGLTALKELRELLPNADLCYFADRKNAPYGTKSEDELVLLVKEDIRRLREFGAQKILIACCTAGTVYHRLSDGEKEISQPIIAPAARRAARLTKNGKIGVIATERTVRSHAFLKAAEAISKDLSVTELEAQELVGLVESGAKDGSLCESEIQTIKRAVAPLRDTGIDTLILGCTHFPHIENAISRALGGIKTVNPSKEGASALCQNEYGSGAGRTIYL